MIVEANGKPVELLEPLGQPPRFALLLLHDLDGKALAQTPLGKTLLGIPGLACASPHGGHCWWSSRICPQFDPVHPAEGWLLNEVVPMMTDRWRLELNGLAVAGVGMGGQGALRLAFKYPERFPVAVAIDAALDHHELYDHDPALGVMYASREHCRQDTAILHIHPAKQPRHLWFACDPGSRWFRGNDRLHEKLAALGVAHTFEVGPANTSQVEALARFIAAALNQESRRLL